MGKVELPDFDDMFDLVNSMKALAVRKAQLETELAEDEAKIVRLVMNGQEYFVGGKAPSMSYVNVTWKITGLHDELLSKRKELAECDAVLESCKRLLDYYKTKIEVWRTVSANERMAIA
jgi:hypothetical protein